MAGIHSIDVFCGSLFFIWGDYLLVMIILENFMF